jgi:hypothetical protein
MAEETESYFAHVVRDDAAVLELIDSNYTFVNETWRGTMTSPASRAGSFRRVTLPEGSPRGGLLTMGGVLMVTSNPTRPRPSSAASSSWRTSWGPHPAPAARHPVAGGGPPRDSRPRADDARGHGGPPGQPACAPPATTGWTRWGWPWRNFNALGTFRTHERRQPIDASASSSTAGRSRTVRDLKKILKDEHKLDFYRCLAEN